MDDDNTIRKRPFQVRARSDRHCGTIRGRDDLERLDVTMRLVHAVASTAGYAADVGAKETSMKYGNKKEIGPDRVKPVSYARDRRHGEF